MVKGPAGYGRYDDDPSYVGCPWARSDRTPCIARDGRSALDGGQVQVCVGCGNDVPFLIEDMAETYEPARVLLTAGDPVETADQFALLVREATEPREEE